jgi:hypothetical protein
MGWLEEMKDEQDRVFRDIREGKCGCHRCIKERGHIAMHMVVCRECGNKRCPHATDHDLACTRSNEPGQTGSIYE